MQQGHLGIQANKMIMFFFLSIVVSAISLLEPLVLVVAKYFVQGHVLSFLTSLLYTCLVLSVCMLLELSFPAVL